MMKRPMNKKAKKLLAFFAVILVVSIGVGTLLLIPPENAGNESSSSQDTSSTSTINLINRSSDQLVRLFVRNELGEFLMYAEETNVESGAKLEYTVEGMEGITLLNSVVQTVANKGYSLVATRDLGVQDDLKAFGLETPIATYTATFADGTQTTVQIGDLVPRTTNSRYVMVSGDSHVYVADANTIATASKDNFLSKLVLDLMATDNEGEKTLQDFKKLRLSGRGFKDSVVILQKDEEVSKVGPLPYYGYYLSEPFVAGVHAKYRDQYIPALSELTATGFAAVNPTEEELKQYGFDDPIELRVWIEGGNYTIKIGKITDKIAYVMQKDGKIIYKVDAKAVEIATKTAFDLSDELLFVNNIQTISSYEFVDQNGQKHTIEIDRIIESTSSTESGLEVEYEYEGYYNGLKVSQYKRFYQSIISAYREEQVPENVTLGKQLFSFKMNFYEEFEAEPITISVYEYNDRRAIYQINGQNYSLVKLDWVNKVLGDFEKLLKDEEINNL